MLSDHPKECRRPAATGSSGEGPSVITGTGKTRSCPGATGILASRDRDRTARTRPADSTTGLGHRSEAYFVHAAAADPTPTVDGNGPSDTTDHCRINLNVAYA